MPGAVRTSRSARRSAPETVHSQRRHSLSGCCVVATQSILKTKFRPLLAEFSQETDGFANEGAGWDVRIDLVSGALADFTQCRIGRNPARHSLDVHLLRDCQ